MWRLLSTLLAAVLLAGCGGDAEAERPAAGSGFAEAAATAVDEVGSGEAALLDVRTDEEYAEGHAAGVEHLPLDDIKAGARPDAPRDQRLYVYCRTGRRAAEAVEILRGDGWTAVTNIGGLADWEREGGAVE